MMRSDDQFTLITELEDQLFEIHLGRLIQTSKRLIKKENMGLLSKCPSQKSPLLLPTRQRTNLALRQGTKLHRGHRLIDHSRVLLRITPPPTDSKIPPHLHEATHRSRKIPINRFSLR